MADLTKVIQEAITDIKAIEPSFDGRIGELLTDSIPSGAYTVHLPKAKLRDRLSPVEPEEFKRQLG